MKDYAGRIARLQERMRGENIALAVFAATDQMRYLTGWAEYGHERLVGLLVPSQGEPAFVVPTMNAAQARSNPAGIGQVIGWDDATGWQAQTLALVDGWHAGNRAGATALVDDELYSVHLLGLQSLFPNLRYLAAGETMALFRESKGDDELAAMQKAADLIDSVYEEALGALQEGMTEVEMQEYILGAIRRRESRPSFSPLICFGANSAMPHHHTGTSRLKRGDIVILDIGCAWEDYASDITRTVAFGEPGDPDAARVYAVVDEAHWAARKAAQPGVSGEQIDAAAREVISQAGYGDYFIHRTGHGIGLSTHEPPYIVAGNTTPLQPRMCFSVEPGIYLPGRFGIRIENIVTMTLEGARSLDKDAPRQLLVLPA